MIILIICRFKYNRSTTRLRKIRIDREDADFVDIIHTDAGDLDKDAFISVLGMAFIIESEELESESVLQYLEPY